MLADEPVIASMWRKYNMFRPTQFVHFVHKSSDGKKEYPIIIQWPQNFSTLPSGKTIEEEGFLTVIIYDAFLEGEREGTLRRMQKLMK